MKKESTNEYKNFTFPIIDLKQTGCRIKSICARRGYTVKKLQEALQIGAFQSIYDWYSGKTLPSLDNMLALSRLLEIPVEELIVCQNMEHLNLSHLHKPVESYKRAGLYYCLMIRTVL